MNLKECGEGSMRGFGGKKEKEKMWLYYNLKNDIK